MDLWKSLAAHAGCPLTDSQIAALSQYLDCLLAANETMNLTRIESRAAAEVKHVADALTLLPFIPHHAKSLADIGSGGGVPGIPLAIARPDLAVSLVESTQKKAAFLQATAEQLKLRNISVFSIRAEELAHSDKRETYDVVTARAVGAMNMLAEWCLPLVRKEGKFMAMKGARITEELPAAEKIIRMLGGDVAKVHPVSLPETEHHVVVEIKKIAKTHEDLPRLPSFARGKPLTSSTNSSPRAR